MVVLTSHAKDSALANRLRGKFQACVLFIFILNFILNRDLKAVFPQDIYILLGHKVVSSRQFKDFRSKNYRSVAPYIQQ